MANGNQSGGMFASRDYMAEAQELMRQRDQQRLLQRANLTPQQQIGMLYGQAGQQLGNVIRQLSGYEDPIITAAKKQRDQEQAFTKTMVDFDAFAKQQNLMPGTASYDEALLGALQSFPQMQSQFRQTIMNPNYRLNQLKLEQAQAKIRQAEEKAKQRAEYGLAPGTMIDEEIMPSRIDVDADDGLGLTVPGVEETSEGLQFPPNIADITPVGDRSPTSIDRQYGKLLTFAEVQSLPKAERAAFNREISTDDMLQMQDASVAGTDRSVSLQTEPAPMGLDQARIGTAEYIPSQTISRQPTMEERFSARLADAVYANDYEVAKPMLDFRKDFFDQTAPKWQQVVGTTTFVNLNNINESFTVPKNEADKGNTVKVMTKAPGFGVITDSDGSEIGYYDFATKENSIDHPAVLKRVQKAVENQAKITRPQTDITIKGDEANIKAFFSLVKDDIKQNKEKITGANNLLTAMRTIAGISGDIQGGVLTELQGSLGKIFPGFSDKFKNIANIKQLVESIRTTVGVTIREEGSGSTSDLEFKAYLAVLPNLMTTPQGRKLMLERAKIVAKYYSDYSIAYDALVKLQKKQKTYDFINYQDVKQYMIDEMGYKANSDEYGNLRIFTDDQLKELESIATGTFNQMQEVP
tara:strand:+ start:8217 stop:10130 length:1914 start_codon:yes stop_codon:yes gene_type:complete